MVDYRGVSETVLIRALWENTRAVGNGILAEAAHGGAPPDSDMIRAALRSGGPIVSFDYVLGRPIKVRLDTSAKLLHNAHLYDRDACGGAGSAARIVKQLQATA